MATPTIKVKQYDPNESLETLMQIAADYYDGHFQPDWDLDQYHIELLEAEHITVQPLSDFAEVDIPDPRFVNAIEVDAFEADHAVARPVGSDREESLEMLIGGFSRIPQKLQGSSPRTFRPGA